MIIRISPEALFDKAGLELARAEVERDNTVVLDVRVATGTEVPYLNPEFAETLEPWLHDTLVDTIERELIRYAIARAADIR